LFSRAMPELSVTPPILSICRAGSSCVGRSRVHKYITYVGRIPHFVF